MKYSNIFIMCLLCISTITITVSTAPDENPNIFYNPIVEVAELQQNGSLATPWIYNLTKSFSVVTKMIWALDFSTDFLDFNYFDGNSSALTNGINVFYNGESLVGNDTIKANHQFAHFGHSVEVLIDEKSPKDYTIIAQWLLTSFIPNGIQITPTKSIQIYIQDDLTSLTSITEFSCTFKGYQILNNEAEQTQQVNQQNNLYIPIISEIVTVFSQNILISVIVVVVSAAVIWKRVFR